jgi:iron complex transport system substrate-binding protein
MKSKTIIKIGSFFLIFTILLISLGGCTSDANTTQPPRSSTQTVSTNLTTTQTNQTTLPSTTQTATTTTNGSSQTPAVSSSTTSTPVPASTSSDTSSTSTSPTTTSVTTTTTTASSSSGGGGGGGGGSSTHYLNTDILGTYSKTKISNDGKINKDFSANSADGSVKLDFPAGTVALNQSAKRLSDLTVSIDSSSSATPEGTQIVTPVYKFGPDNATFSPAITLTLTYDLTSYTKVAEDLLYFACYNPDTSTWDEISGGTYNTTKNTATISISHFSTYAILGHTIREITDMYGTKLTVPAVINKVLSGGPVETQLIYMLAPDKLAGVNGTFAGIAGATTTTSFWNTSWDGTAPYIPQKYLDEVAGGPIPDIGNGSSKNLSYEQINLVNPDVVIEGKSSNLSLYRSKINCPVIGVNAGSDLLTQYSDEITFVGNLLGEPQKAADLISYYNKAMHYVNDKIRTLNDNDTVTVYYAEKDGTYTDGQESWHTNLLRYCKGYSVADLTDLGLSNVTNTSNSTQVSIEQIYLWNEETPINLIILGRETTLSCYTDMMNSAAWQELDCIKKDQVFFRPCNPISWFDGPPGYGQIIGMYWMIHLLYPNKTADINLYSLIKEFYSDFLHFELTDDQVDAILSQPTP